jgi:hypothetical protein
LWTENVIATLARRHRALLCLVAVAILLRMLVMIAYPPAFWFNGDSGGFIENSFGLRINQYDAGGLGYSVALKVLRLFGSFAMVAAVQHLTGIALAIAVYALLYKRGVPIWLACIAAAPVLFDSLQVTIEHYVLGETLFTALAVTAVFLLLWPERPSLLACTFSGFLIMLSWFTRPSTLPVAAILLAYLALRRLGWKKVVAFAAAFVLPYLATLAWIGDRPSAFGSSYANRALYSRVAAFADCDRLTLTGAQRDLCPQEPLGQRHDRPDWYGWNGPALAVPKNDNDILRSFAVEAITQQPGDYAATVFRELAPHFVPGVTLGPEQSCLREKWSLPERVGSPVETACTPALTQRSWQIKPENPANAPGATALSKALSGYSDAVRLTPLIASAAMILVLLAMALRRWGRDSRDALVLALIAATLIVLPVLVAMYEARYSLPALPFLCVAVALALHHLLTPGARRKAQA